MGAGARDYGERDAGEVFMLTFAAVGALALLDSQPAAPALYVAPPAPDTVPDPAPALLSENRPADARPLAPAVPAAADAAFFAAALAFSPAPDAPSSALPADARVGILPDPDLPADDSVSVHSGGLSPVEPPVYLAPPARASAPVAASAVTTATPGDVVRVLADSVVEISGAGARVLLAGADRLTLSGTGFAVQASGADNVVTLTAGSQATVLGAGVETHLAAPDAQVTVGGVGDTVYMAAGGAVSVLDSSSLAAHGVGAAYLGAGDFVSLFGAFDVYAPSSLGNSVLSSFGASDTLHLNAAFADIAALFGAASQTAQGTVLHLSAQDNLTLAGVAMPEAQSLAQSGHIRLG